MSKLNGTLTQIRWETAAAENTCAACCSLQNKHLGSIWLIMIYFSCNHLFMLLWFIFHGTGLCAKGLGAEVGKHPPRPMGPLAGPTAPAAPAPAPHGNRTPGPPAPTPLSSHPLGCRVLGPCGLNPPFLPTAHPVLEPWTRHTRARTSMYAI